MFNVLPQEQKIEIQKEYKARRLVVIALFFVVTLAIGLVLLFPSYLTSQINNKSTQADLTIVSDELKKGTSKVASPEDVAAIRDQVTVLNAVKENVSVYSLFSSIIEAKSSNIKLSSFSFNRQLPENALKITVEGKAKTRDSLTQFGRALEAETQFSAVDLPISNLAKDKDIDFSMIINVRP